MGSGLKAKVGGSGRTSRGARAVVAAGVVSLLGPGAAAGTADGCSFDAATGTVTASVSGFFPEKARGNTMSVDGGAILFEGTPCGGATATNTDSIVVTGSPGQDVFVVDARSGLFAPGATPDPDGSPEIELRVDLGGGADLLRLFATRGPDRITVGSEAINLDRDTAPNIALEGTGSVVVFALGGNDVVSGRGGAGTGAEAGMFVGVFGGGGDDRLAGGARGDALIGGAGADVVVGRAGQDVLSGKGGPDVLAGLGGADFLIGGGGPDRMRGGPGNDQLNGVAGDDRLRGGPGRDDLDGGRGVDGCRGGSGTGRVASCER